MWLNAIHFHTNWLVPAINAQSVLSSSRRNEKSDSTLREFTRKFETSTVTSVIIQPTPTSRSCCTGKTYMILIGNLPREPRWEFAQTVEKVCVGTIHWRCTSERSTCSSRNFNATTVRSRVTENTKWKAIWSMSTSQRNLKTVFLALNAARCCHRRWAWRFICNTSTPD